MSNAHYNYIADIMENGKWLDTEYKVLYQYRKANPISIDLETWGAANTKEGLSHKRGYVAVIALHAEGLPPAILHYPKGSDGPSCGLMRFLERKTLVGHNINAFDIPFLGKYGFRPMNSVGYVDTLVAEQLAMLSGRRDLKKDLATTLKRRLKVEINKQIDHKGWGNETLTNEQIYYVLNDVTLLQQLWQEQWQIICKNKLEDAWQLEHTIAPIVSNMVLRGMPIDLEVVDTLASRNEESFGNLLDDLMDLIETDAVNSPKQLKAAFLNTFGYELLDTKRDTLLQLSGKAGQLGKAAGDVSKAREFRKRGMYGSKWLDRYYNDGRINSRYVQLGTDTSRFAARDPNLQQIPSNMREMFGYDGAIGRSILKCDYSQIEALIFALQTKEYKLINWYKTGRDIHSEVAANLFNKTVQEIDLDKKNGGTLRKTAKACTFAMLFAGGKASVIRTARKEGINISDYDAKVLIHNFFRTFPSAGAFIDQQRLDADKAVRDQYGIILKLPNGPKRALYGADITASRLVNTVVQGTASVGLKLGLVECLKANIAQYIIAVVHDEVVLDVPTEEVVRVQQLLEQCMKDGMRAVIGLEPKVESAHDSHWPR